jgi:hypothetical protein
VSEPQGPEPLAGDTEEVDALLVDSEDHAVVPRVVAPAPAPVRTMVPAVQAAAVAATGFVAGAAVVGLVSRRHSRALAQGSAARRRLVGRGRGSRGVEVLQVVNTRSLLVDVHLLGGPESS